MAIDLQGDILLRDRATGTLRDVERGVDRLSQSVQQMERQGRRGGGGDLLSGLLGTGAGRLVGGFVGGLAAREVLNFAGSLEEMVTEARNGEAALRSFAGGAGAAEARIRAVQEAAGGAVGQLAALRIANQGAALGFADSAEELDRVTTLAAKVATVFGGEVTPTIDNMAAAAANLSFVRLDTLGISADRVRRRFEELRGEIGDTAAFMQAMLEVGEETFAGIEPAVSATGELRTALADLKLEMAETFGPGATDLTRQAADSIRDLAATAEIFQLLKEGFEDSESAAAQFRGELLALLAPRWGAELGDIADGLAEIQAEMRAIDGEAFDEMGDAALDAKSDIEDLTDAVRALRILAGQVDFKDLTPAERQRLGPPDPMFADPGTGPKIGDILAENREQERADLQRQILDLVSTNRQAAEENQRNWERAARETQREFERAAKEAERAWKNALSAIPGLPGGSASEVTQQQMQMAEAGIPQNFADDFLRQARDELVNGVDWPAISRGLVEQLVAASTGADRGALAGLSGELLSDLLQQEFISGRLFGTELGQQMIGQLINLDAVRAERERQAQAEGGLSFVDQFLRGALGGPQMPGAAAGLPAVAGGGQDLLAGVDVPQALSTSLGEQDLATPMIQALQAAWGGQDFLDDVSGIGVLWIQSSLSGAVTYVEDGPPELDRLAAALLAALLAAINEG